MNPTVDIPGDAPPVQELSPLDAQDLAAADISPATGEMERQADGPSPVEADAPPRRHATRDTGEELSAAAIERPVLIEVSAETAGSPRAGLFSRRILLRGLGIVVLTSALVGAAWFGPLRPAIRVDSAPAQPTAAEPSEPAVVSPESAPAPGPMETPEWVDRMRELDRRRSRLLAKAEEVRKLQGHYRYGVLELEEDAVRLIKRHRIETFAQAVGHPQVEFALQSIRSRQAYVAGLTQPLRWLAAGSEQLLYLQRLVAIDREVLAVAEGVDLDAHAARVEVALSTYRPTAENLAMGAGDPPPPLDALFKRLADQARQIALPATESVDAAIAEEVCAGEMTRYSEVSVLRLKAARCLAESAATELFLNRVVELPGVVAQKLSEWPGSWLCLNGLKRISPEAARHLFAWPGRWISLNGLTELPASASAHLPAWGGRQIELMGVKKVESVEHLVRWEEAGGKLFLPEAIRRQVDEGRRALRPATAPEKEQQG